MKRFKSYVNEEDLKDFEEDCTLHETKKEEQKAKSKLRVESE